MVLHTLRTGGGLQTPESFSAPKVYNILPYLDHNRMLAEDGSHWELKFARDKAIDRQFRKGSKLVLKIGRKFVSFQTVVIIG